MEGWARLKMVMIISFHNIFFFQVLMSIILKGSNDNGEDVLEIKNLRSDAEEFNTMYQHFGMLLMLLMKYG